jgi:hypothetical protein
MSIKDIVNVQITRETTPVSQLGFGTMMVLGTHKVFPERIRFYQTADAMLDDGFGADSPEYEAASLALSQIPSPVRVAIGRRDADDAVVTVSEVDDTFEYSVTINGTEFAYQAQAADTNLLIAAGLVAAINGGSEPVTATDNLDGTFGLAADVAGVYYSLEVSDKLTSALSASQDIENDLTDVNNENSDWYALVITSRLKQDVLDAAAWVEARIKLFGTASSDTEIYNVLSTTDIAAELFALNYARTFLMFHDDAATLYPEAAWFGKQLPTPPGSSTWAFKSLAGVPTVDLTETQRTNILAKNANTYELRAGVAITKNGQVAEGEFIDIIRGVDWLDARMTERIYSRLVNSPKIPFTDPGVAIIEAEIRAQLDAGIAQGLIALDPAYTVTVPLVKDVPFNDRANRNLPDIKFRANLQGAIHAITVFGTVTV